MPFFSIVIPTYNRAYILEETLFYIQQQDYKDWECVIVDDGSKDNTKAIVSALMLKDNRIKYVYQNNAERSAARNNGAKNSSGQYLLFLDSDDAFAPNYLSELHQFLSANNFPKALLVSDFCTWDGKNTSEVITPSISKNPSEWLFDYPVSPSRACVHSEIIQEFKFREDIVIVEDSVLWVSIATKFPVLHFQKPLVWYRVHEGNSVNPLSNSGIRRLAGLKLFFNDALSKNLSSAFKNKILSNCYFSIAQFYFSQKQKRLTFVNLFHSLAAKPKHEQSKAKLFLLLNLLPGFTAIWQKISRQNQ